MVFICLLLSRQASKNHFVVDTDLYRLKKQSSFKLAYPWISFICIKIFILLIGPSILPVTVLVVLLFSLRKQDGIK